MKSTSSFCIGDIQPLNTIPSSYQHDDGNFRYQKSLHDANHIETIKPSKLSRMSGRSSSNDYRTRQLFNITDYHDLLSERRIYRDRAAAKIQAAYRGYTVRKSLPWLNKNAKHLYDKFDKLVNIG